MSDLASPPAKNAAGISPRHTPATLDIYTRVRALATELGTATPKPSGHGSWHEWSFALPAARLSFRYDDYSGQAWVIADLDPLMPALWLFSAMPDEVSIDRTAALNLGWKRLWLKISDHIRQNDRRAA